MTKAKFTSTYRRQRCNIACRRCQSEENRYPHRSLWLNRRAQCQHRSASAIPRLQPAAVDLLHQVQNRLFSIGAYLATPNPDNAITRCAGLSAENVEAIENVIDHFDAQLPRSTTCAPGGTHRAAVCHVCRTMCRRCERRIVALADQTYVDPNVLRYINRLSDFFVFARFNNVDNQTDELFWDKEQLIALKLLNTRRSTYAVSYQ